ncbi:NAD(P)-dependent alcohol dehydrogenase [Sphaerisporangium sp. TRM90804]|uniref:NAD(P)-dependent alcohol dehydrogenase n=1 Tax=Sphaerisporangium sp. TRM90804 TaxID=3031113 RepID=UPI0024483A59|nr:NAD(P)-dependent alcohol dehydrogenase [Sphaerisporangium sp. TRM90804]MDH2427729.1 NAD(P)-dependent alcohol dehydrogenase [Sphaerisporangium sp. TRM90804]
MKAIVQDTYGSADVLRLRDVDTPVPGDDEVLLQVRAAGVDQGVRHSMTGTPYLMRVMGFGLRAPKARPGSDVAGRVEAVGAGVTRFKPGDEVFGSCGGSFAEFACAKQGRLAAKPANLTFEQAAAVPVSACTALQGLRAGRLAHGQRVLVIGASGGVGTFAVQIAKALGAHVTGVCGTAKTGLVRSIGADEVIDYSREDFADRPARYDLILDIGGVRPLAHLRRALTPKGTLVMVGGEDSGMWVGGAVLRTLRALVMSPFIGHDLRGVFATVREEDLRHLTELIEAGKVTPAVDRTYPLVEVPDAIRYLSDGHARGKLVITV